MTDDNAYARMIATPPQSGGACLAVGTHNYDPPLDPGKFPQRNVCKICRVVREADKHGVVTWGCPPMAGKVTELEMAQHLFKESALGFLAGTVPLSDLSTDAAYLEHVRKGA